MLIFNYSSDANIHNSLVIYIANRLMQILGQIFKFLFRLKYTEPRILLTTCRYIVYCVMYMYSASVYMNTLLLVANAV